MLKKKGNRLILIMLLVITIGNGAHVRPPAAVTTSLNLLKNSTQSTQTTSASATNNLVAYNEILDGKYDAENLSTFKHSSVVQDWKLVCKQLCGAGLGGQPCASHCLNISLSQNEITSNAEDILNPSKTVICKDLCRLQLGVTICQCTVSDFLKKRTRKDQNLVCKTFCDHNEFTLPGCSLCPMNSNDYDLNNSTTPTITTTPSTTPDWNAICKDLCKTGDGGALCNCDLPPFFKKK